MKWNLQRRINSIRSRLRLQHRHRPQPSHLRVLRMRKAQNPEYLKARAKASNMVSGFLVVQRRSINALPWFVRWVLRAVYFRYGWACSEKRGKDYFSIEYQAFFLDEADAYWAANQEGLSYTEVPINASLPLETVKWGKRDHPHSDASHRYRDPD